MMGGSCLTSWMFDNEGTNNGNVWWERIVLRTVRTTVQYGSTHRCRTYSTGTYLRTKEKEWATHGPSRVWVSNTWANLVCYTAAIPCLHLLWEEHCPYVRTNLRLRSVRYVLSSNTAPHSNQKQKCSVFTLRVSMVGRHCSLCMGQLNMPINKFAANMKMWLTWSANLGNWQIWLPGIIVFLLEGKQRLMEMWLFKVTLSLCCWMTNWKWTCSRHMKDRNSGTQILFLCTHLLRFS